jgi:glucose/arabinose dehydrogenase
MRFSLWIAILSSISFCQAQTFPTGFTRQVVASGISSPTVMTFAPDGRIFIAQQSGALRVIKNGSLLTTPFITLSVNSSGERGLIGIALDPDFSINQYIYLYYTVGTAPIHNRISRFTANGDVVMPGSESILLELDDLSGATNHNGGALAFGSDGKLYVAVGDNANTNHPQNLETYHGKMLRINKDGSAPVDNPFNTTGASEKRKRIWSYGLRNPYTFSIQPGTGKIFVNEVGQNTWEEVNDATQPGRNFGWPGTEGPTSNPSFTSPAYAYHHNTGTPTGCAITGGAFFSPSVTNYPSVYLGKYFFQDYCSAWIYYIDPAQTNPTATAFGSSVGGFSLSLTMGPDGNLYYLSRTNASLYRVIFAPQTGAPTISEHPVSTSVTVGQPVTFSVVAAGSPTLRYQWLKNGVPMNNAIASSLTISSAQLSDEALYSVIVSNNAGSATSTAAQLSVTDPNQKPTATITQPFSTTLYTAGTSIVFAGTGTDPEDGTLPAQAFSWEINFHHDTHFHDQPVISGITSGAFDVPDQGETSAHVWYRFILTVTDSEGSTDKDTVDVYPRKSIITLQTDPPGLQLLLDGQPVSTPISIESVEGLLRTIGVETHQQLNGGAYSFDTWLHGGTTEQTIATPVEDVTYTARFSLVLGIYEPESVIYPQPAVDFFIVKDVDATHFQLIDGLGRSTVLTAEKIVEGTRIGLANHPAGLYVLQFQKDSEIVKRKILIQR